MHCQMTPALISRWLNVHAKKIRTQIRSQHSYYCLNFFLSIDLIESFIAKRLVLLSTIRCCCCCVCSFFICLGRIVKAHADKTTYLFCIWSTIFGYRCVCFYMYQNVKPITIDQLVYLQQTIAPRHQNKSKRIKRRTTIWKIVQQTKFNAHATKTTTTITVTATATKIMLQFKLYSIDYTQQRI